MSERLENMTEGVSRRDFLRNSASIVAGSVASATGMSALAQDKKIDISKYITKDERLPVPSSSELSGAVKFVKEILQEEYVKSDRDVDAKKGLSERLLRDAQTEESDLGSYAMLVEARDKSAEAKHFSVTYDAITSVFDKYKVTMSEAVNGVVKSARISSRDRDGLANLVEMHMNLTEHALAANDYDGALGTAKFVYSKARSAGDVDAYNNAKNLISVIPKLKDEYETVADPKLDLKLSVNPNDSALNHDVGSYLCFVKDAWDDGLPFLSRSGNRYLKALANSELKKPTDDNGQYNLAKDWADAAKKSRKGSLEKDRFTERALYWYGVAYGQAKGLLKSHIQKEMSKLGPPLTPSINVITLSEFEKLQGMYQRSNNLAEKGTATAESIYGNRKPERVFTGTRKSDSWALNGPKGWFQAEWSDAAFGRYILLFGRPFPVGNDPWGKANVSINGSKPYNLEGMTSSKVTIIDLKRMTPINSLKIEINTDPKWYPGIAALEIYGNLQKNTKK